MKEIARRVVAKNEGMDLEIPEGYVGVKKIKRLMEKVQEAKEEDDDRAQQGRRIEWPNRHPEYAFHGQAFHILDTVRMGFICEGDTTEAQVDGCIKLFEEFRNCTVEKDGLCVLRQKNGFAAGVQAAGGYADVKLLIYAELGTEEAFDGAQLPLQMVGEIQIILRGYMTVKHKMHLVYEVDRGSFDRDARVKANI